MIELEEIKRLYIFVDTTNAFSKEGLLADSYVLHTVFELIRIAQIAGFDENGKKIFIVDYHTEDSVEFERYSEHSKEGTNEVKIISELVPYTKDALIFRKNSTSAIFAKNFIETILKMLSLEEVVIVGWDTDICVMNLINKILKTINKLLR